MAGSDLTVEGGRRNTRHNLVSLFFSSVPDAQRESKFVFSLIVQAIRYKLLRHLMTVFLPCRPGKQMAAQDPGLTGAASFL